MTTPAAPCRLAVFLSRKSPIAVILRRGPSAWAQLTQWDRNTDTFTPGQWFHGHIYERRCDLSPDGRLFIYFAAKHGRRDGDPDGVGESWTAISRPPYFTALALWPFRPHKLKIEAVPGATAPWEQRLLRDQWVLEERGFDPRTHRRIGAREIWSKSHPESASKLCREIEDVDFQRYGGPYGETFWLEVGDELIPLPGVSWAEWEDWDHVVFVRAGRLLRALPTATGLEETELCDFNPLTHEEITTPDWARRW
jgi:hypothetical protein